MTTTPHTTATESTTRALGSSSAIQEKSSLLTQIQAKCDSSNYVEAAKDLQVHLGSLEGVKDQELLETHRFVRELLPYLFDLLQANLEAQLQPLLGISSHLPEQQWDLAMRLGELNEKKGRTLLAMHYYATAANIEKHCLRLARTADGAASSLLLKTLCQYFKETVEEASSSENRSRVEACLRNVVPMTRLCSDLMEASAFYDALGEIGKRPKLGQTDLAASKITETYRAALNKWRSLYASKQANTRELQREIFMGARDFFEILLKQAFNVLGDPPCKFDIRATGPLGREEMCPFSGFGMMILIEDERHTAYFGRLAEILELQITSLGETPALPLTFTCLPVSFNSAGFHLDPGGNPAGEDRLIQTPQGMASLQQTPSVDLYSIEYVTLRSSSLLANDAGLFEAYLEGVKAMIKNEQRQALARDLLRDDLVNFNREWANAHNPNPHLERQYSAMLDRLLMHLALYWGLESINSLDIIEDFGTKDAIVVSTARGEAEKFSSREVFTAGSITMLKDAVEMLYRLRIRAHLHYEMAKEEVTYSGLHGASSSRVMPPCVVTRDEQRALEQIYHLVLSPLYSRVATVVEREYDLGGVFHQLDFLETAFAICMSRFTTASIPMWRPLIAHLAAHLLRIKAPLEEHIFYYEQLLKVPEVEPLCEAYIASLEALGAGEVVACLESIPNSAGLRRAFIRQGQQLLASVAAVTTDVAPAEHESCVRILHSSFGAPRFLRQEVIHQILDENGDIRHHYRGSAHPVSPVISGQHRLHFKQKPTHSLMEDAMHDLFFRIGGDLTPATELFRFEVRVANKTKMYPVLISTTIPGTTLKDSLGQRLAFSDKQWERLTWMRLCTVLTYSGDGRLSNYLLDPQNNVYCVDNEVSLLPPVLKSGWSRKVTFCSALFCHLEPTRPLPVTVLREFCALDADAILHGWIQDVIKKEPAYVNLFTPKERSLLLSEDPENKFKATILLQKGALATLNNQFYYMQDQIRRALREGRTLNSLDLLNLLIDPQAQGGKNTVGPLVHQAYKEALVLPSVEARLQAVTARSQDRSMRSVQADQLTYGKAPTLQEIEQGYHFSPGAARGELFDVLLHSVVDHAQVGRARSGRVLAANFAQFQDVSRQRLILEALIAKSKEQRERPSTIILQNCLALGSKDLELLLHADLRALDLRGCGNIQDKDIATIQQRCPNLVALHLSGCSQLKSFCGGWISASPLEFGKLETLHIDHCDRLTVLQIRAPLLKDFRADANPLLSQLVVISHTLPGADSYKECRRLGRVSIRLEQLPSANL